MCDCAPKPKKPSCGCAPKPKKPSCGCGSGSAGESALEKKIMKSKNPIEVQGTKEVKLLGHKGLWVNQDEAGISNVKEAEISQNEPRVINKQSTQKLEVEQLQGVKFLRPPPGPAPGKIIITQEPDRPQGPAPPLIIRQGVAEPCAPKPCVIREAPPSAKPVGGKKITIAGKCLPPPPRKVIIEKLAPLPERPGDVIVERWLGMDDQPRCVIFKPNKPVCQPPPPENVIIQWSAPCLKVNKKTECLGVNDADPCAYKQKYGSSLKNASELPDFARKIKAPGTLAADSKNGGVFKLVGDLEAFKLINLDEVGMSEYRSQLKKQGIKDLGSK